MQRDAHATATLIGLSRTARRRRHGHGPQGAAVIYDLPTYLASGSRTLAAAQAGSPTLDPAEQAAFERIYAELSGSRPGPEAA